MTFLSGKFQRNWNSFVFALEVACVLPALWWIPYDHLPAPGYSVVLIAVAAALMSIHDEMTSLQRTGWLIIMASFLSHELRAISKDRWDNEQRQASELGEERLSFKTILKQGRSDNLELLAASANTLASILQQNQDEFKATIQTFDKGQISANQGFKSVLGEQEQLFKHEEELAEAESGRLEPGNEPTPPNSCAAVPADAALIIIGEEAQHNVAFLTSYPTLVFEDWQHKIRLYIDRDLNRKLIPVLNLRSQDGHIVALMNTSGYLVNRSNSTAVQRTSSHLTVTDLDGKIALDINYLNKHTISIKGEWIKLPYNRNNTCLTGSRLPM